LDLNTQLSSALSAKFMRVSHRMQNVALAISTNALLITAASANSALSEFSKK